MAEISRLDGTLNDELQESQQNITSVKEYPAGVFGNKTSDNILVHIYDLTENYLGSSHPSKLFKQSPGKSGEVTVKTKEILNTIGFTSAEFEVEIDYVRLLVGNHPESENGALYIDSISTSRDELVLKAAREVSDGSGQVVNDQISQFQVFANGTTAEKRAVSVNNGIIITDEGVIDELFLDFDFGRRFQVVNFFSETNESGIAEFFVKLSSPLPQNIQELEQGYVYQKVRNSQITTIDLRNQTSKSNANTLRKPNYDVDLGKQIGNDGDFKTFNDLISTQGDTSDKILRDVLSGSFSGVPLNIDYSDYNEFVKYSSAHERLENFTYKMELVESYDSEIKVLQTAGGATGSTEVLADISNLGTKKTNIIALGAKIFFYTIKINKPKLIIGMGIPPYLINFHKKNNFIIKKMSHHFMFSSKKEKKNLNKLIIKKIDTFKNIKDKKIDKLFNYQFPIKSSLYIENRFIKHPIYKYFVYSISFKKEKCLCIFRLVKHRDKNIIRIVDYVGSSDFIKNLKNFYIYILEKYDASYLDFYSYGLPNILLKKSGLSNKDDFKNLIIPNHFEPFQNKNIDILIAYLSFYKNNSKIRLFKADSDMDRPHFID